MVSFSAIKHHIKYLCTTAVKVKINDASGMIIYHTAVLELFHTAELNCTNTNYTYKRHNLSIFHCQFQNMGKFDSGDLHAVKACCLSAMCKVHLEE